MKVLVRLDDFTPNRRMAGWRAVEELLERHNIKPLVAVVPDDRYFGRAATTAQFWEEVRAMEARGWSIAMHGDTHELKPIEAGAAREIFFATKSEFVGLSLAAQLDKLTRAWNAFEAHGVRPIAFVAPGHGFDGTTVEALSSHGLVRIISDGVSLRPFKDRGLYWVPQVDWSMPRLRVGFRTVCLHPSTTTRTELRDFSAAVERYADHFVDLRQMDPLTFPCRGIPEAAFAAVFSVFFWTREALGRVLPRRPAEASN